MQRSFAALGLWGLSLAQEAHRVAITHPGGSFNQEVAFLFPWAVAFGDISMTGFWSMMVFLAILTIGFAYEWKKGALEWE